MPQPGLTANLDSFDLLDLVQVIHMDRRDLSLVVRDGPQSLGVLRFSQGELLWAEFRALRGEEAFIALAAQKTGSLEQLPWDGRGERNVSQPLARLIMQAVAYRDAQSDQRARQASGKGHQQPPAQASVPAPGPAALGERLRGVEHLSRLGDGQGPAPGGELPDDEPMPAWVREIRSASEAASAQSGSASQKASVLSPAHHLASASPPDRMHPAPLSQEGDTQPPQPTLPLSVLNGKFTLPSLGAGNRMPAQGSGKPQEDPPTIPLPTVQGGLLDYASKREPPPQWPPQEEAPQAMLETKALPEQAVVVRSPAAPAAPAPSQAVPTLASAGVSPGTPVPPTQPQSAPAEPKFSSLSLLEQLAYGGVSGNGGTRSAGPLNGNAASGTIDRMAREPLPEPMFGQHAPSSVLDGAVPTHKTRMLNTEASASGLASGGGVSGVASSSPAPPHSGVSGAAGSAGQLQQALETFAGQVGAVCIATAVIRADGSLVAEYTVRRSQEQELASPAYHLAHVMQSSLRALLMGGWGDLEDAMITGSTHLVLLRRLGRAEKGLFHIAVLERSGNSGLCRVRMRNSEPALLQAL